MSDLSDFFHAYESGQIGAVDLYEQLPPEMRKSVDEMLKATTPTRRGAEGPSRVKSYFIPKGEELQQVGEKVTTVKTPARVKTQSLPHVADTHPSSYALRKRGLETKVEPVVQKKVTSTARDLEMSVDKGKEEEKKDDDDSQKDEIRDVLFEGKEDLDKPGTANPQVTAAYGMAGGSQRKGPVDTSTPYAASLSASLKAKENQTASRYGIETVRKSFVGHSCTHCQRLHKSVGKVCDECRKSMNSTVWHSGSHLE
jgi:hypothetical protein